MSSPVTHSRRSTAPTKDGDIGPDGRIASVNATPGLTKAARFDAVAGGFDYETIPDGYYDLAYRRRRGIQSKWHHLKFERVIEEMKGHPRHLDVGCGPGTLIGLLDDRFSSTGVDISRTQIAYARREYESDTKRFFAVHPRALPDDCRDYDVATAVELIEHLSSAGVDDVLGATIERLRCGGKLVVTTPNGTDASAQSGASLESCARWTLSRCQPKVSWR